VEHGQVSVAQRFVDDLAQLRQLAGRPSYSALERLSGHRLKRATMSDVLNGNRVRLPDWRFVHEFVTACRSAAAETQLDANELGTVADWKRHWDAANGGVIDARFPGHGSQSFGRQEQAPSPGQAAPALAAAASQASHDPDRSPAVWGPVPSRLPDFVGRESWLEALRQALTSDDRVIAIQGLPGTGKTQLAIEYANRHARDYDLVWWVPCDDRDAAHGAMTDLAARLGVAIAAEGGDERTYAELFDVLRHRERYPRWLLIFDHVSEPEEIRGLLPPLSGDVVVTTRSSRWEASGELLELDVFDRAESIEFLRRRMHGFGLVDAHRLADGVGDLPLLLEHAVESRIPVNTYLARLDSEPLVLLAEQPADYHATIAAVWQAAVDQLRAEPPDALELLRCLAFFGNDPVPRESLERGSYLREISVQGMLRDPFRRVGAIRKLRRAGLLRVRADTGDLEVHRITRCLVRDLIAKPGTAERQRARHDVHLLLAAADPLTPNDPATWRSYDELRGHAAAAGIMACSHEMVRKSVVNLVRYLNAAGDPSAALAMADAALAEWDGDSADAGPGSADERVAMRAARADALFATGAWSAALRLRQQALAAMRLNPERWTTEIIDIEGTSGAHCRITGTFGEALAADRRSVRVHKAEFGDDDPRTFTAVNSLVADLTLAGQVPQAAVMADGVYRDCLEFYSDHGHPAVLAARNVLGRCRWLSGAYAAAADVLTEVHAGYNGAMLDEDHPWRLVHEIDYAIARRDKGLMPADLEALAADVQQVRRRCWRALGVDHPQTLAATVVLASVLRRIGGRAGEAVNLLAEANRRYQLVLPDHPYGHACGAFLAVVRYQAANGNQRRAAAQAIPVIQGKTSQLADSLGVHPLSQSALNALANALATAGEVDAAVKHAQEALIGFQDLFTPDHPYARAVAANLELIRSGPPQPQDPSAPAPLTEIDFSPLPL